jgi:hypothetical protein
MMPTNQAERFANEAIFILQFNTPEAVRYVQRNAGVAESVAKQTVKSVVQFHKQPHTQCVPA